MPIDYSEYGIEFIVKSRILRSYGRCALCGARQGGENPETGATVVLTVHHLDEDKGNNDLKNLVPLCQGCHLACHRGGGIKLSWSGLHREYLKWYDVLLRFAGYTFPDFKISGNEEIKKNQQRLKEERDAEE